MEQWVTSLPLLSDKSKGVRGSEGGSERGGEGGVREGVRGSEGGSERGGEGE